MSGSPYNYQSLQPREIRLLELHPGTGGDAISAHLHSHNIDTQREYEAISYVWGDPKATIPIICDSGRLLITTNLNDVLLRFRLTDRPRLLWTDAICINQKDLKERSSQIQLMHLVYGKCQRVLVWLGHRDVDSEKAIRLIRDIGVMISKNDGVAVEELDKKLMEIGPDGDRMRQIVFEQVQSPNPEECSALGRFLCRPWFTRVWVIQEIYFSQDAIFICGDEELTYALLYYAAEWLLTNSPFMQWKIIDDMGRMSGTSIANIMTMRKVWLGEDERPFDHLLDLGKSYEATDKRDKVYAQINFPAFKRDSLDLVPDYSKSVQEVYTEVTMSVMRNTKNLRILTCIDPVEEKGQPIFPSWIPRWDRPDNGSTVARVWYEQFSAGLWEDAPHLSIDLLPGGCLHIEGIEFDTIEDVCSIKNLKHYDREKSPPLFTPHSPWKPYEIGRSPYPSELDIVEAYTMTFTAQCWDSLVSKGGTAQAMVETQQAENFVGWLQWLRSFGDQAADIGSDESDATVVSPESQHEPPGLFSRTAPSLKTSDGEQIDRHATTFHRSFYNMRKRRLFRTRKGYLGIGNKKPRPGDKVCIFFGGRVPFLLRERDSGGGYVFVGEAYVHGIMQGEVVDMLKRGDCEKRIFPLY